MMFLDAIVIVPTQMPLIEFDTNFDKKRYIEQGCG
jgi:hypothetical protein